LALRELKKLRPLDRIEPEHARQIAENGGRGSNRASLFEPRVPGRADAGQLRDLLTAQAGSPTPQTRRQARRGRRNPRSPGAEEITQFLAPDLIFADAPHMALGGGINTRIKNTSGTRLI
jgi:hypothetical protein